MSFADKRDVEMWASMTIGLASGTQERERWKCRIVGLVAAMVAAGTLGYIVGRSWLPMWARAVIVVGAFFAILYVSRDFCRKRSIANEEAERRAEEEEAAVAAPAPASGAAPETTSEEPSGTRPAPLTAPRGDGPDDLTQIRGVGPKLQTLCNELGIYHYDQIAAWTEDEVAWMDANLEGFKGRVSRDEWIAQAGELASKS